MDGKTLRGTRGHAQDCQPSVHLLALYEPDTGIVVAQESVEKKKNEITASEVLLKPHLVKGRIISADAIHTQWKFCMTVHYNDGYYLLTAKKNHKETWEDLHVYFEDKDVDQGEMDYFKKVQKGHGRLEVREIWTSSEMNEYFKEKWPGISKVFKIRRYVKDRVKERVEIVYGFTNLTRQAANAECILELNQRHWCVENRLHYRRDVTMGEDASQVRVNHAPESLAALNGGVLAFMDLLGVKNVASQMRHFCAHPEEIIQLIFGNLSAVSQVN
jgi:predicted transposase YbfD/YdcC